MIGEEIKIPESMFSRPSLSEMCAKISAHASKREKYSLPYTRTEMTLFFQEQNIVHAQSLINNFKKIERDSQRRPALTTFDLQFFGVSMIRLSKKLMHELSPLTVSAETDGATPISFYIYVEKKEEG